MLKGLKPIEVGTECNDKMFKYKYGNLLIGYKYSNRTYQKIKKPAFSDYKTNRY